MTICIAASCAEDIDNPRIILCADWRKSGALGTADTALKMRNLFGPWTVLTAGEEGEIRALIANLRMAFFSARQDGELDETNVVKLVRDVLTARKKQKAEDLVRGQYAMSYEDFLKNGKAQFPEALFRDAMASVRDIQIEADLIIAGFYGNSQLLMETDRFGRVAVREDFAVVGEGAYLAQSVMLHRQHSDINSIPQSLYTVYEAKRYAEGAPSVGEWTTFDVMHPDGSRHLTTAEGRLWLKDRYEELGPKKLPNLAFPNNILPFKSRNDNT